MKKLALIASILSIFSCTKKEKPKSVYFDSFYSDSVRIERNIINDSIYTEIHWVNGIPVSIINRKSTNHMITRIVNSNGKELAAQDVYFHNNGKVEGVINLNDSGDVNGKAYYFNKEGNIDQIRMWRDGKTWNYGFDYYNNEDTLLQKKSVILYTENGAMYFKRTWDQSGNIIEEQGSLE